MELKGAVALVTGGSEGIGRGIAVALKAEGSVVTITGRREDVLRDTAEQIGVEYITGDVDEIYLKRLENARSDAAKHGKKRNGQNRQQNLVTDFHSDA